MYVGLSLYVLRCPVAHTFEFYVSWCYISYFTNEPSSFSLANHFLFRVFYLPLTLCLGSLYLYFSLYIIWCFPMIIYPTTYVCFLYVLHRVNILKQTTIHFGNGQLGKQDVLSSRQERYGWGCTWFWIGLSRQCLSNLFKAFRNIWCCLLFPYPCKFSLLKPFCRFKYGALRWDIPWPNHFIILSICRLRYIFLFFLNFIDLVCILRLSIKFQPPKCSLKN